MKSRIHYEDLEKRRSIQNSNRGVVVIKLEQMNDKELGLTQKDKQKPEMRDVTKKDMQEDIAINEFEEDLAKRKCSIKSSVEKLIKEIDSIK